MNHRYLHNPLIRRVQRHGQLTTLFRAIDQPKLAPARSAVGWGFTPSFTAEPEVWDTTPSRISNDVMQQPIQRTTAISQIAADNGVRNVSPAMTGFAEHISGKGQPVANEVRTVVAERAEGRSLPTPATTSQQPTMMRPPTVTTVAEPATGRTPHPRRLPGAPTYRPVTVVQAQSLDLGQLARATVSTRQASTDPSRRDTAAPPTVQLASAAPLSTAPTAAAERDWELLQSASQRYRTLEATGDLPTAPIVAAATPLVHESSPIRPQSQVQRQHQAPIDAPQPRFPRPQSAPPTALIAIPIAPAAAPEEPTTMTAVEPVRQPLVQSGQPTVQTKPRPTTAPHNESTLPTDSSKALSPVSTTKWPTAVTAELRRRETPLSPAPGMPVGARPDPEVDQIARVNEAPIQNGGATVLAQSDSANSTERATSEESDQELQTHAARDAERGTETDAAHESALPLEQAWSSTTTGPIPGAMAPPPSSPSRGSSNQSVVLCERAITEPSLREEHVVSAGGNYLTDDEHSAVNERVRHQLSAKATAQPTEAKVDLILPRHPRPVLPPALQQSAKTTVARSEPQSEQQAVRKASNGSELHTQMPAADPSILVPTAIGPLPADLWSLVGKSAPIAQRPAVEATTQQPAPTGELTIQRRRPPNQNAATQIHQEHVATANHQVDESSFLSVEDSAIAAEVTQDEHTITDTAAPTVTENLNDAPAKVGAPKETQRQEIAPLEQAFGMVQKLSVVALPTAEITATSITLPDEVEKPAKKNGASSRHRRASTPSVSRITSPIARRMGTAALLGLVSSSFE